MLLYCSGCFWNARKKLCGSSISSMQVLACVQRHRTSTNLEACHKMSHLGLDHVMLGAKSLLNVRFIFNYSNQTMTLIFKNTLIIHFVPPISTLSFYIHEINSHLSIQSCTNVFDAVQMGGSQWFTSSWWWPQIVAVECKGPPRLQVVNKFVDAMLL